MTDTEHGRPDEVFDRAARPELAHTEAEGQPDGTGSGPTHERSRAVTSSWPKFDRALRRPLVVAAVGTCAGGSLLVTRINSSWEPPTLGLAMLFLTPVALILGAAVGVAAGAVCAPGQKGAGVVGTLIGWGLAMIALSLGFPDVMVSGGIGLVLLALLPLMLVYLLVAAFRGWSAKV